MLKIRSKNRIFSKISSEFWHLRFFHFKTTRSAVIVVTRAFGLGYNTIVRMTLGRLRNINRTCALNIMVISLFNRVICSVFNVCIVNIFNNFS